VSGREQLIEFHIVNRIGDGPHDMEMALARAGRALVARMHMRLVESRLFDLNGETDRVSKRQKSAIIAVDVRRFGHAINTDEVFGTHNQINLQTSPITSNITRFAGDRQPFGFAVGTTGRLRLEPVEDLVSACPRRPAGAQ
jgi:hypothetical protein